MKRILFILISVLMAVELALGVDANPTYKITRLNTPSINIGGKQMKVGDSFSGTKNIKWTDSNQAMEVQDVSTGNYYKFSEKVFHQKGAIASIADFFLRTSQGSGRDLNQPMELKRSPVSSNYPEKRIALVIGNSNYENLSYLRNAQKDASDISDALLALGFDVIEVYEATYQDMMTGLNKFASQAKNYDVAMFYYAGHGTQYEGKNYLLPINFENDRRSELARTLHADDVLQRIEDSGAPSHLIFIDACRNVPMTWTRDSSHGLARMEGGIGSVIVFSTESGKTADDGDGDNSPFAASLINNMGKAVSFDETINGVAKDTYELTGHKQFPLRVGMLLSDFRFNPEGVELAKVEVPKSTRRVSGTPEKAVVKKPVMPAEQFAKDHPNAVSVKKSEPVVNESSFVVTTGVRDLTAWVGEVYREGQKLVVELILKNVSSRPLKMNTMYSTEAISMNGETYKYGSIMELVSPNSNAALGFTVVPNVPLKMYIWIEGMNSPDDLAYIKIPYHLQDKGTNTMEVKRK